MKTGKVVWLTALLLCCLRGNCQSFFTLSTGLGFAGDNGLKSTVILEPKIAFSDHFRFGLASKIGLETKYKSFLADLNIKPSKKSSLYFGVGFGSVTFLGLSSNASFNPISGFTSINSDRNYISRPTFTPRIGLQGVIDFEVSYHITDSFNVISFGLSYVIGHKGRSTE